MAAQVFTRIREKVKKHGWKAVAAIFLYYLIRDSILYIFIPYILISK